jgi:signal transduction histidine kinase/ActR/RegA family two-component response regulator
MESNTNSGSLHETWSSALMESVIQSDIVALSVLEPEYLDNSDLIINFRWVVANKLLKVIAKGQDVTGKLYTEVFPSAASNGVLDTLKKVFTAGIRQEHEIDYDDGIVKGWLRQVYVRSHNYIIVSAEDITLAKKADEELKEKMRLTEMNARLKEMNEAKTKFFNNASHEFRTPLTLILGPLQDVMQSADPKLSVNEKEKLQIASRNGQRLQKLVNNLLDFSRIEAGRLDAIYQPTDLVSFTADIVSNFRSVIEEAGLKFVFKAEELNERIYVNHDMWEKIVLNLLSNAFKFTQHGKIEVKLEAKKFRVQLIVRDTGIGIGSKNIDRVFERFVQLESPGGRTQEGTGIGLSLVKELVTMHGGTIKLTSKKGKGSTFVVSLKRGKSHLPASQIYETKTRLNSSLATSSFVNEAIGWLPETAQNVRGQLRPVIMVVEDNADMRKYISHIISGTYDVILAENGQAALNILLKGTRPDLIVSDVMMPLMDGYDLVSAVKNNPRFSDIPVILLSARSGEDAMVEGMETGADDYIEKPFSSRELLTFIKARIHIANLAAVKS